MTVVLHVVLHVVVILTVLLLSQLLIAVVEGKIFAGKKSVYLTIGIKNDDHDHSNKRNEKDAATSIVPIYYDKIEGGDEGKVVVVAFEADYRVVGRIVPKNGFYNIPSIVGDSQGLAALTVNGRPPRAPVVKKGTSFADLVNNWFDVDDTDTFNIVAPTVSFENAIDFIPPRIHVRGMATTLNRFDYRSIFCNEGGTSTSNNGGNFKNDLRRIPYIYSEIVARDYCEILTCMRSKQGYISGGAYNTLKNRWISPQDVDSNCATRKWNHPNSIQQQQKQKSATSSSSSNIVLKAYFLRNDTSLPLYSDEFTSNGMVSLTQSELNAIYNYNK